MRSVSLKRIVVRILIKQNINLLTFLLNKDIHRKNQIVIKVLKHYRIVTEDVLRQNFVSFFNVLNTFFNLEWGCNEIVVITGKPTSPLLS